LERIQVAALNEVTSTIDDRPSNDFVSSSRTHRHVFVTSLVAPAASVLVIVHPPRHLRRSALGGRQRQRA
jgi:hypothetical protein